MRDAWILSDVQATERLGATLGRHCPWGSHGPICVFLSGDLGTGKTTIAAAALHAVGVVEAVRSPTYALVETYSVCCGLAVHVDLYRLADADELEQLGLREYLRADTLIVIEWPERAGGSLPQPDLHLRLEVAGQGRVCGVEAATVFGEAWLALVEGELASTPSDLS